MVCGRPQQKHYGCVTTRTAVFALILPDKPLQIAAIRGFQYHAVHRYFIRLRIVSADNHGRHYLHPSFNPKFGRNRIQSRFQLSLANIATTAANGQQSYMHFSLIRGNQIQFTQNTTGPATHTIRWENASHRPYCIGPQMKSAGHFKLPHRIVKALRFNSHPITTQKPNAVRVELQLAFSQRGPHRFFFAGSQQFPTRHITAGRAIQSIITATACLVAYVVCIPGPAVWLIIVKQHHSAVRQHRTRHSGSVVFIAYHGFFSRALRSRHLAPGTHIPALAIRAFYNSVLSTPGKLIAFGRADADSSIGQYFHVTHGASYAFIFASVPVAAKQIPPTVSQLFKGEIAEYQGLSKYFNHPDHQTPVAVDAHIFPRAGNRHLTRKRQPHRTTATEFAIFTCGRQHLDGKISCREGFSGLQRRQGLKVAHVKYRGRLAALLTYLVPRTL